MLELPHHYRVTASASAESNIELNSNGLQALESAPPVEFGGPGDRWSPETLLVAAVADCFALSFRAIAHASRVEWVSLECEVNGTLDRIDRKTQFTAFDVRANLVIPAGTDEAKALRMLQKAEDVCLITNSLIAESHLEATVKVAD